MEKRMSLDEFIGRNLDYSVGSKGYYYDEEPGDTEVGLYEEGCTCHPLREPKYYLDVDSDTSEAFQIVLGRRQLG